MVRMLTENDFKLPPSASGTKLKILLSGAPLDFVNGYYKKLDIKTSGRRVYQRINLQGQGTPDRITIRHVLTNEAGRNKPVGRWTVFAGRQAIYRAVEGKPKKYPAEFGWRPVNRRGGVDVDSDGPRAVMY
jgi:hypothetical protein